MQEAKIKLQKYSVKIEKFMSLAGILIFSFVTGGAFWLSF